MDFRGRIYHVGVLCHEHSIEAWLRRDLGRIGICGSLEKVQGYGVVLRKEAMWQKVVEALVCARQLGLTHAD